MLIILASIVNGNASIRKNTVGLLKHGHESTRAAGLSHLYNAHHLQIVSEYVKSIEDFITLCYIAENFDIYNQDYKKAIKSISIPNRVIMQYCKEIRDDNLYKVKSELIIKKQPFSELAVMEKASFSGGSEYYKFIQEKQKLVRNCLKNSIGNFIKDNPDGTIRYGHMAQCYMSEKHFLRVIRNSESLEKIFPTKDDELNLDMVILDKEVGDDTTSIEVLFLETLQGKMLPDIDDLMQKSMLAMVDIAIHLTHKIKATD